VEVWQLLGVAKARRCCALVAVSLGMFCVQWDAFALNLALPQIGREFAGSDTALSWVVSAYLLAAGALMLGAGRLGDCFGRRRTLAVGLTLFAVSSLLCAAASALPFLIAARAAQGAGSALIIPAGLALLTSTFPAEARGRAVGIALGVAGMATACGPIVGGALTQSLSWRAVFWATAIPAVIALLCACASDETRTTSTVDFSGMLSGTAALAAIALVVDRVPRWGLASLPSLGLLVLALALTGLFLKHQSTARDPLVASSLFRNGPYVVLTVTGAVANVAAVVFLFVVPLSLQGHWGLSPATAGAAFLAPAVAMAGAAPLAGRVRQPVAVMARCLAGMSGTLFIMPLAASVTEFLAVAAGCGAVLGLANAVTLTGTQALVQPERAGQAAGVTKAAVTLCGGFGLALSQCAPAPVTTVEGAAAVLRGTGVVLVAAGALLMMWSWNRRGSC
jgi:MFS family permease